MFKSRELEGATTMIMDSYRHFGPICWITDISLMHIMKRDSGCELLFGHVHEHPTEFGDDGTKARPSDDQTPEKEDLEQCVDERVGLTFMTGIDKTTSNHLINHVRFSQYSRGCMWMWSRERTREGNRQVDFVMKQSLAERVSIPGWILIATWTGTPI
jgi:hypothetical protein